MALMASLQGGNSRGLNKMEIPFIVDRRPSATKVKEKLETDSEMVKSVSKVLALLARHCWH